MKTAVYIDAITDIAQRHDLIVIEDAAHAIETEYKGIYTGGCELMLVTIVTPYYNGEEHILETINGVRNQTIEDWEYFIVDDGSQEESHQRLNEIAAGVDERVCVLRKENGGQSLARNYGFNAGDKSSKYVLFLDHDDILEPDTLEILIDKLNSNEQYVAAHGLARFFGGDPLSLGVAKVDDIEAWGRKRFFVENGKMTPLQTEDPTTFAALAYETWISTPGQVLFRRSILEKAGLYNRDFAPADDWEMCLRASQFGPIGYVDAVVLNWRRHESSMTTAFDEWTDINYKVRYSYVKNSQVTKENRETMKSAYRYVLLQDFKSKIRYGFEALSAGKITSGLKQFGYGIKPVRNLAALSLRK